MNTIATIFALSAGLVDGGVVVDMGYGSWALCCETYSVQADPRDCGCCYDVLVSDGTDLARLTGRNLRQVGLLVDEFVRKCSVV